MGNNDAFGTDTTHPHNDSVTTHPHNDSWVIISLKIHKPALDHLQHPQFTFYNPYLHTRKLTVDPWTLILQEKRTTM